jgi:hypothetical protein
MITPGTRSYARLAVAAEYRYKRIRLRRVSSRHASDADAAVTRFDEERSHASGKRARLRSGVSGCTRRQEDALTPTP